MLSKDVLIKQMLKKHLDQLPPEEREKAEEAIQNEDLMARVQEIVEQLSPHEQQQLMQAMVTGNMAEAQKVLQGKLSS